MRPQPHELIAENYPFHVEIPTRFGDTDSLAHINNVSIARLFEEARYRFNIAALKKPPIEIRSSGRTVTASVAINYMGEVHYPESVDVYVGVQRLGTSSVTYGCLMKQSGKVVAQTHSVLVRSDGAGGVPFSQDHIDLLKPWFIREA